MKTARVLVVWGSETNQTQNEMKDIVDDWLSKGNCKVLKSLEGDKASEEFEDINASNYDFLIVGTSSYGDGDPPSGYGKFLYKLYEAAKSGNKQFQGMQHAVIGFGSTVYDTYQNCPRLTDKLIGESGSVRCSKRVEIDEMEDENEKLVKKWADELANIFESGRKPNAGAVCDWKIPSGDIIDKALDPDGFEVGHGPSKDSSPLIIAAIVVFGAFVYYNYSQNDSGQEVV